VPSSNDSSFQQDPSLALLDDLLTRCARKLAKEMEEKPKLGDFIKMIELRRKIAPGDAEQQKLLKLLEKARRNSLAPVNAIQASSGPKRSRNRRKKGRAA
jgi:hypothetical protein